MKILHIDTSVNEFRESKTRQTTKLIVDEFRTMTDVEVVYKDLVKEKIPFITKELSVAMFTPKKDLTLAQEELLNSFNIDYFLNADVCVFGLPSYFYNVPAVFKNWLEHLFRMDVTVDSETWVGKLRGKKIYVVSAWGGDYTGTIVEDTFQNVILSTFNFFGINDVKFFHIYLEDDGETSNIRDVQYRIIKEIHR